MLPSTSIRNVKAGSPINIPYGNFGVKGIILGWTAQGSRFGTASEPLKLFNSFADLAAPGAAHPPSTARAVILAISSPTTLESEEYRSYYSSGYIQCLGRQEDFGIPEIWKQSYNNTGSPFASRICDQLYLCHHELNVNRLVWCGIHDAFIRSGNLRLIAPNTEQLRRLVVYTKRYTTAYCPEGLANLGEYGAKRIGLFAGSMWFADGTLGYVVHSDLATGGRRTIPSSTNNNESLTYTGLLVVPARDAKIGWYRGQVTEGVSIRDFCRNRFDIKHLMSMVKLYGFGSESTTNYLNTLEETGELVPILDYEALNGTTLISTKFSLGASVTVNKDVKFRSRNLKGMVGKVILTADINGMVGVLFSDNIRGGSLEGIGENGKCLLVPESDLEEDSDKEARTKVVGK